MKLNNWHRPTNKHWSDAFSALHNDNSLLTRGQAECVDPEHPTKFVATFQQARKPGHVIIILTPMSGNAPQTNFRKWQLWPFVPKDSAGRASVRRMEVAA